MEPFPEYRWTHARRYALVKMGRALPSNTTPTIAIVKFILSQSPHLKK
jgi:hypothetical protein